MIKKEYLKIEEEFKQINICNILEYKDYLNERKILRRRLKIKNITDKNYKFKYEILEMFIISMGMIGCYSLYDITCNKANEYNKLLFSLCINISNNFFSTLELANKVLNFQADNLMRANYELVFYLLTCLIDKKKLNIYLKGSQDVQEKLREWRKNFKFSKLNKTVSNYMQVEEFDKKFADLYSRYSNFCHADFNHCLVRTIADSGNGIYKCNLWGDYSTLLNNYIDDMIELAHLCCGVIPKLVLENHSILKQIKM